MAKPRVFVSSTYKDLRQIRESVGVFIREHGYEEVMFEHGNVPYGVSEAPAEYCYEEVELCDILVSIIGQRFGANSSKEKYSISQTELRRALELGKTVYIFVEKAVLHEYSTYKANKETHGLTLRHADDPRVYEFLDELYALPHNNPIFGFEYAHDIVDILRQQWAGLFHRLLRSTAGAPQRANETHPAFQKIRELLRVPFQVGFQTREELSNLLTMFGYHPYDSLFEEKHDEWVNYQNGTQLVIRIAKTLFGSDGRTLMAKGYWRDGMVTLEQCEIEIRKV